MTTQQVADRLVELCSVSDYKTAYEELYSPDIISTELDGGVVTWIENVIAKSKKRDDILEKLISSWTGEATVIGNIISLPMWFTAIYKGQTEEKAEEEIAIYEVTDWKITRERFFYDTSGMKKE